MNVDKIIKLAVYRLKRTFGKQVDVYRINTVSTDFTTGIITASKSRWRVRKAISLPKELIHKFSYTPTFTVANKNTTEGGYYDLENQTFIIDGRDLPKGFVFHPTDYLVVDCRYKYELVSVGEYGSSDGFMVVAHHLRGQVPDTVVTTTLDVQDQLTVEDANEPVVV